METFKKVIKCPHCNAQYIPAQVLYPSTLLGKPKNVIKDPLGKIIFVQWQEQPEYKDSFICQYCNREFIAYAQLSLKTTKQQVELDFTNQMVSLLD